MKACWSGWGCAGVPSPSSVTTFFPTAEDDGYTQERTLSPFTCTVHAPHCESPQPKRGPRRPRSSRNTYSSGTFASSTRTFRAFPLTVSRNVAIAASLRAGVLLQFEPDRLLRTEPEADRSRIHLVDPRRRLAGDHRVLGLSRILHHRRRPAFEQLRRLG